MGFAVPLARWFRGPCAQRVREAVLGPRLAETGWFNPTYLRHLVEAHQSGARDYSSPLWTLLMFEAFLRTSIDSASRAAQRLRLPHDASYPPYPRPFSASAQWVFFAHAEYSA